MLRDIKLTSNR